MQVLSLSSSDKPEVFVLSCWASRQDDKDDFRELFLAFRQWCGFYRSCRKMSSYLLHIQHVLDNVDLNIWFNLVSCRVQRFSSESAVQQHVGVLNLIWCNSRVIKGFSTFSEIYLESFYPVCSKSSSHFCFLKSQLLVFFFTAFEIDLFSSMEENENRWLERSLRRNEMRDPPVFILPHRKAASPT